MNLKDILKDEEKRFENLISDTEDLYEDEIYGSALFKEFLVVSHHRIIDEIIKWAEKAEVMGIGGDFGEGYEAGFKKATSDLISKLKEVIKEE